MKWEAAGQLRSWLCVDNWGQWMRLAAFATSADLPHAPALKYWSHVGIITPGFHEFKDMKQIRWTSEIFYCKKWIEMNEIQSTVKHEEFKQNVFMCNAWKCYKWFILVIFPQGGEVYFKQRGTVFGLHWEAQSVTADQFASQYHTEQVKF